MAKKSQVGVSTSSHLGDRVHIKDLAGQVGDVAELRCPLGPGGASVYRVRVWRKPTVSYIELLGDQLEYLPMTGQVVAVTRRKSSPAGPTVKTGG